MNLQMVSGSKSINRKDWSTFVGRHPQGTIFQSCDMLELFENSRKFFPLPLAAYSDKKIVGVLLAVIIKEYRGPVGFFSARTVIYGGPLIAEEVENKNEVVAALLENLIGLVKNRSIFIQFRNFTDCSKFLPVFEKHGFNFMDRLNYLVDTTSEDNLKRRVSKSKLRQIRKGLEAGAEIIQPENEQQVKTFYSILHKLYKFKVKKPLPHYSFFKNFYEQSRQGKLGVILLIKFQGRIIGGIVSPVFTNQVIYEWYVCGLDHEYKHLYPSVLATWAPIDYALKNNIAFFDFMGVGVPDKDYGVREFKSKFGGELVNYGRFGRINNKVLYFITEIGFNLLALMRRI